MEVKDIKQHYMDHFGLIDNPELGHGDMTMIEWAKELLNAQYESQKSAIPIVSDQRKLLIKYQNWYWREVQGKPYQTTASDIVDLFDE